MSEVTNPPTDYASRLLSGDRMALARVISKFENRDRDAASILKQIFQNTGRAKVHSSRPDGSRSALTRAPSGSSGY